MRCERCSEPMVVDHFMELEEGFWARGWRCTRCGDVVDSSIIRSVRRSWVNHLTDRLPGRHPAPVHDVIPLGI